ncbi:fimbria/pilus periplasmic chaperone [Pseudocitrobacter vendiensis]|uniref:Fimbrial chaperone YcbF n=1 Tax=Pseudocitrobacter vendiensis TaxID=2488306 RepID=A0ABM9F4D9_9ENTR|nr:fimbria/pilus periplasmic chaperone [Pseudocitrobacter vendiensis]CAH6635616.1 putative fimbrial chaperone YcbF [Pseudocitrobacter vendiensis]
MTRLALLVLCMVSGISDAGVVVGGTRFVFPSSVETRTISVTNTSNQPWLINSKISTPTVWAGVNAFHGQLPVLATPPLFLLPPGSTGTIRLVKTDASMPNDREMLFALSVASIPSGRVEDRSVKVALRSSFKLFWRPASLKGDPEQAWQKVTWRREPQGVIAENPTPFYINLTQVTVNGQLVNDAGVLPPLAQRHFSWCATQTTCTLRWRTFNDLGGFTPITEQRLP